MVEIYDKTVPKVCVCFLLCLRPWSLLTLLQPILDVLAEMIAYDGTIKMGKAYPNTSEIDVQDILREMAAQQAAASIPSVGLD